MLYYYLRYFIPACCRGIATAFGLKRGRKMLKKRKIIALITSNPESMYQKRVMQGVFCQCNKYGYDVAVFSTLVHVCHYYKDYLQGELNIYNLINCDLLDGIIVTALTLSDNGKSEAIKIVKKILDENAKCPIVSMDETIEDCNFKYDTVYTDDRSAFKKISRHVFEKHGCKNVYFLAGYEGHNSSTVRLAGFIDYLRENDIPVDKNKIFYGDFWYSSGEKLADDIAEGKYEIPDAVICASDHMAIGLTNRLVEHGISVPERVIVTGYDSTQEAIMNDISITTFSPEVAKAAAEAVNIIRKKIEPNKQIEDIPDFPRSGLKKGDSCGCNPDILYIKKRITDSIYSTHQNVLADEEAKKPYDISRLLESYMYESLISTESEYDLLNKIYHCVYLIAPYKEYYLCLKENWLDKSDLLTKGYPPKMKIAVRSRNDVSEEFPDIVNMSEKTGYYSFDSSEMFPEMFKKHDKPSVYYFSPVHFNEETLGYSVLKCDLSQNEKINYVYRNWIRNVNNALEMLRIRLRILNNSMHDITTGLYNRRGMYIKFEELLKSNSFKDIFVLMADMDRLKYINDTFGHSEGDFGLKSIANALSSNTDVNEISVRIGGDEFVLIGIGDYNQSRIDQKLKSIEDKLVQINKHSQKPYNIYASMGFCIEKAEKFCDIDSLIKLADEKMYINKKENHKNRTV